MLLKWNRLGDKRFETGLDRGVLYIPDVNGDYTNGVAWNGLTSVSHSFEGARVTPYYIDGIKYRNVPTIGEFAATLEAFTYPDEFAIFDGAAEIDMGFFVQEQPPKPFGLSYRTTVGNDVDSLRHGYKIHLVYGAMAVLSELSYETFGDSPDATTFSWDLTALPVVIPGFKPASSLVIDSTKVDISALYGVEDILYGNDENAPRLPLPSELADFIAANKNPSALMTESNHILLTEDREILLRDLV